MVLSVASATNRAREICRAREVCRAREICRARETCRARACTLASDRARLIEMPAMYYYMTMQHSEADNPLQCHCVFEMRKV